MAAIAISEVIVLGIFMINSSSLISRNFYSIFIKFFSLLIGKKTITDSPILKFLIEVPTCIILPAQNLIIN